MNELDDRLEAILADCLRAIDRGATVDECLARYPDDADVLRPLLELRSRLASTDVPEPAADAYDRGRRALLEHVSGATVAEPAAGSLLGALRGSFARAASVLAVVLIVGAGAIGASAAGGFQPARDVLDRLRIIDDEPSDRPIARPTATPADDRPTVAPTEPARPIEAPTPADDRPSDRPVDREPTESRPADARPTPTPTPTLARPSDRPSDRPAEPTTRPVDVAPTQAPSDRSGERPADTPPTPTATPTQPLPRDGVGR